VYDYGVYLHAPSAARRLQALPTGAEPPDDAAVLDALVRGPLAADMSLVMVTARRLPLETVGREVGGLLQRRLRKVGGSPEDPALAEMLAGFTRPDALPPECLAGGGLLRKRSTVTFARRGGRLRTSVARAGGAPDVTVSEARSPDVCAAFFDTYLGSDPVHAGARRQTADGARALRPGAPGAARGPGAPGAAARLLPQVARMQRLALALAGMPLLPARALGAQQQGG